MCVLQKFEGFRVGQKVLFKLDYWDLLYFTRSGKAVMCRWYTDIIKSVKIDSLKAWEQLACKKENK